jgi:hypothetical protein
VNGIENARQATTLETSPALAVLAVVGHIAKLQVAGCGGEKAGVFYAIHH